MIELDNLTKYFWMKNRKKVILENVSITFPTQSRVALLGRNGAGKSTLLQMIAGTLKPTSGRIISTGSISYPVGFGGSFHPDLTGTQSTRFVARIYGIDTDELIDFVKDFSELGPHFYQPIRTYSSGMRSRLAFGISMGIPFDTYLVDEVTSVGDKAFRNRSVEVFNSRMETSGAIVVSHSEGIIRRMCNMGVVLENGKIVVYDNIDDALEHHKENLSKN